MHLALRETRRHFSDPRVLGAIAIVALILGISGPFGSFEGLETPARLAYWAAVVLAAYVTATTLLRMVRHWLASRLHHPAVRILAAGAVAGLPVTAVVVAINLVVFGLDAGWRVIDPVALWLSVTLIAMGVSAISILVERSIAPHPAALLDTTPALLERLPLPLRGPLLSLSVADHYVEVTTAKGRGLVLMRLSDAIREARPTPGLQIHRSHWVALDAVARTFRAEGRLVVELKDGRRLPISRGYLATAREAGLRG